MGNGPEHKTNHEDLKASVMLRNAEPLNNFDHRTSLTEPLTVKNPKDAITEPTIAQRERLVFLADDALEVLEAAMESADENTRLKAAENVLDRAGLGRNNRTEHVSNVADIPAEALVQVIGGLSAMFGKRPEAPQFRNVSPERPERPEPSKLAKQTPPEVLPASKTGKISPALLKRLQQEQES